MRLAILAVVGCGPAVAALAAAIALAGGIAAPANAQTPSLFTIAGAASSGAAVPALCDEIGHCESPRPWPSIWTATARRLDGTCLDHFADGSILLCTDGRLVRVAANGTARAVPVHGDGQDAGFEPPDAMFVLTADVAPDGAIVTSGTAGVASIAPDGTARWLYATSGGDDPSGVDVLADGSALVAEPIRGVIERVWPDGRRHVVAGASRGPQPDGVPARRARIGRPADVSAFADGSFVVATEFPVGRVLLVDPGGTIHRLAGGGSGWREGARATTVSIGPITAVRAVADGRVLLAADRGVLAIDLGGRIRTVVRGVPHPGWAGFTNRQSIDTDGRALDDVVLAGALDIDALPDGQLDVLTRVPTWNSRLALIGGPAQLDRLAVALPGADRQLVRTGRLEVIATRPSRLHITVRDRTRGAPIVDTRASVPAGRSTIRIAPLRGARVHDVRVTAVGDDGSVSSAGIAVIPERFLTTAALAPLTVAVDISYSTGLAGQDTRRCRRASRVTFTCRWVDQEEGETGIYGSSRYTLRADGLVDYSWRRDHRRRTGRLILEPMRRFVLG